METQVGETQDGYLDTAKQENGRPPGVENKRRRRELG